MKCEKCGVNNATTHIHTVINGKVTDMNLCGYCAANTGLNKYGHMGLINLLASVFDDASLNPKISGDGYRCGGCGATFADIAAGGLVGCPECYRTFYRQLFPTVKRIHGRTNHAGKIPQSSAPRLGKESRIEGLRRQMAKAVETENFELAATLRDEIKEIEGDGANG